MQQPTDYRGVRRELPSEALASCVPALQPAHCGLPQKQQPQQSFPSEGPPDDPLPLPSVPAASSAPLKSPVRPPQQQHYLPSPSSDVSNRDSPTGCQSEFGGLDLHATFSWGPPRAAPGRAPPYTVSHVVLNADTTRDFPSGVACSSNSRSSVAAPSLPVRPAERPKQLRQEDVAYVGALMGPPAKHEWGPLPVHSLPTSARPSNQHAAAAGRPPHPKPGCATNLPMGFAVGGSPAGGPPVEGATEPLQEPQVLLQQLQQNETMQRQILRHLQQQQQRWLHLLEACEVPPVGGAFRGLPEPALGSSGAGAPAAFLYTSPEGASFVQERQQFQQTSSVAMSVHTLGDAFQPCGLGATGPMDQRHGRGVTSPQPLAPASPSGTPLLGAPGGPCGSMQQNSLRVTTAANFSEAQAWPWEELRHSTLWSPSSAAFTNSMPEAPPQGPQQTARGPPLQQQVSWRAHPLRGRGTRAAALSAVPPESPAGGIAAPAAVSELGALASAADAAVAAAEMGGSVPGPPCEPPYGSELTLAARRVKDGATRRRARRLPGRKGGPPSDFKRTPLPSKSETGNMKSPQSSSRSPSIARTAACAVLGFGSAMPLQTKLAEAPAIGLVNLGGGSCFLNVVLQCIAHLQPLRDFYLHYAEMLPPSELLGRQYEAYTSYLEASRHHVRRLKRGPHQLIPTPTYTTSVTWELAVVINHMWRSPGSVRFLKPEALYQVCCRIMPDFDPREMQDSDEFLRLLLDFLDGELRAAATGVPLHKALMMQAMPKKLEPWPSRPIPQHAGALVQYGPAQETDQQICTGSETSQAQGGPSLFSGNEENPSGCRPPTDGPPPGFADLPTLFSVFFEGAEVDKVRCTRCGRCTATLVPFKSLAVAMTQEAQEDSCQHASLKLKPASFFHLLTKVDLVECLNRHFADDCDSLKLSSGEGYFCEQCNSKQDAVKSCSLVKDHLPFILCLTLKRFVRGKQTYKIWNPVQFDEFVDFSRYVECSSDSDDAAPTTPSATGPQPDQAASQSPSSSSTGRVLSPAPTETGFAVITGGFTRKPSTCSHPVDEQTAEAQKRGYSGDAQEEVVSHVNADAQIDQLAEKQLHCGATERAPALPACHASAAASKHFPNCTYRLVALVEHEGPATEQGHYVCYVKHMGSEAWFRADDKVVEPVDLQRVLAACPYILFYQRLSESSGCSNELFTLDRPRPSADRSTKCREMYTGFAGLQEQLEVANGLSQGHWRQWQNMIVGLFKSFKAGPETGNRLVSRRPQEESSSSWDAGKRFTRQKKSIVHGISWQSPVDDTRESKRWQAKANYHPVFFGEGLPSAPSTGVLSESAESDQALKKGLQTKLLLQDTAGLLCIPPGAACEDLSTVHSCMTGPVLQPHMQKDAADSVHDQEFFSV